ncbi:hypothetical protein L3Q82_019080 [Scortum barcoo]|uniref:Uncharacterized protein n=1 Tax=Scortum barcoo TaxID=214431 RepID=A0ACB8VFY1_9TELE|nr:hypothetical protein L3Q82_019080 [Scortum barcoo]
MAGSRCPAWPVSPPGEAAGPGALPRRVAAVSVPPTCWKGKSTGVHWSGSRLLKNIAEMDAPSGFFFGLEKKNGQKEGNPLLAYRTQGRKLHGTGPDQKAGLFQFLFLHFTPRSTKRQAALQEEFCSGLLKVSAETNSQARRKRFAGCVKLQGRPARACRGRRAPGVDGLTVGVFIKPSGTF